MKKSTKTLISLISIVTLAGASVCNAVHTVREKQRYDAEIGDTYEAYSAEEWARRFFMWRDGAASLHTSSLYLLGKNGQNGVHFASGASLIERPDPYNEKLTDKSIAEIAEFANSNDFNVYLAVIPPAFEIYRDKLGAYTYDDRVARIYERLHISFDYTRVHLCDPCEALERQKNKYIYYRTDPHLTSLGSYYVYRELGDLLGFDAERETSFDREAVTDDFKGELYNKAPLLFTKADNVEKFILPGSTDQTLEYPYQETTYDSIYDESRKDYYTFPTDDHIPSVIHSNCGTGKVLAVIRADFDGNAIVPFLANHYSEIYLDPDLQYIRDNGITDILILCGAESVNSGHVSPVR